jgi:hypothetical protein
MILACAFGPTHKAALWVHVNHTPQPAIDLAHWLFTIARVPQANSQHQTVQIRVRPQVVNYDRLPALKIDAFPCLNNYGLEPSRTLCGSLSGVSAWSQKLRFAGTDAVRSDAAVDASIRRKRME